MATDPSTSPGQALPGRLLVLDGPEGAGKTTQVQGLVAHLQRLGHAAVAVRDPGSTVVSERIREILLDHRVGEIDVRTELFLYMASRAEMVARIIRPALEAGEMVVSDRFVSSTVAYQGYAGGLDPAVIWEVGAVACGGIEPALTVVLDLPVAEGFARLKRKHDRMESKDRAFHERVRHGFLEMARARPDRFAVVDASRPPDDVARAIAEAVTRVLR